MNAVTEIKAERQLTPADMFKKQVDSMQSEWQMALPSHVPVERFIRVAKTSVLSNPDLLAADRKSLFESCTKAAQDGLMADGREAALVIFNTKEKYRDDKGVEKERWVKKVQYMPMIAGVLAKLRRSGEIAKISSQVVYENDEFLWRLGFDEDVIHNPPPLDKPRGKEIGAYATAVLKDGSRLLEVMSKQEIEQVRNVSRAKDSGPWKQWWGEMARKTVMRRLSKRLPMSAEQQAIFDRDNDLYELRKDAEVTAPLLSSPAEVLRADAAQPAAVLELVEQPEDDTPADEPEVTEAEAEAVTAQARDLFGNDEADDETFPGDR